MIISLLGAVILFLLSYHISILDIKLLTGKYNYSLKSSNYISYLNAIVALISIGKDFISTQLDILLAVYIITVVFVLLQVWILAKIKLDSIFATICIIISFIVIHHTLLFTYNLFLLSPFIIMGLYYRNNPFGLIFKKNFILIRENKKQDEDKKTFNAKESDSKLLIQESIIPNFSKVGCNIEDQTLTKFIVSDYDILPNTDEDLLIKVQNLIDLVGKNGGGCLFFPKGTYLFNKSKRNRQFLQINYSNITLEGEVDQKGSPLVSLINCNHTLEGKRNPWLSPFFITTGEKLQPSNIFFGLQFKNKKNLFTKSDSQADPGSDGTILTPEFASNIVENSPIGSNIIKIEDSSKINGSKYIMVGMYNTTTDGNLIKEILNCNQLNEEWGTALRAGSETAPSFQWLVEIDKIIDNQTIRLKSEIFQDIKIEFSPAIFIVPMLENIRIKNLKISSKWNGLFRHHGCRFYYSIKQTQEMDYGWNGINMKRTAHGVIENVILENFSNPLYILDSRNITAERIIIEGHDGHQGIKLYEHACENLIQNIEFKSHFADMMGGEGNAYMNVFSNVQYRNSSFNPVDFDFHGFSEGPMSPPAYNLFENVKGFRYVKGGGALYNQPACAQKNIWWNCISEGEKKNDQFFVSLNYIHKSYSVKTFLQTFILLVFCIIKRKGINGFKKEYKKKITNRNKHCIPVKKHHLLFPNSIISGLVTSMDTTILNDFTSENLGSLSKPYSLYHYQKNKFVNKNI